MAKAKGAALPRDVDGGTVMQTPTRAVTNWNQKSPYTISSVESPLDIPTNCFAVIIQAKGADVRVAYKEGGTVTGGTYDIVYDGNTRAYPVVGWDRLFLLRNASTDVTVTFQLWLTGFVAE